MKRPMDGSQPPPMQAAEPHQAAGLAAAVGAPPLPAARAVGLLLRAFAVDHRVEA